MSDPNILWTESGRGPRYVVLRSNLRCPTCDSPKPERHPAMQFEGEVEVCADAFHLYRTNANRPEYIAAVEAKRAANPLKAD